MCEGGGSMKGTSRGRRNLFLLVIFASLLAFVCFNTERALTLWSAIRAAFSPVFLGCVLAFVMNELLKPLERLWDRLFAPKVKARRAVCLLVSVLVTLGVVALVILIILPELVRTMRTLVSYIPQAAEKARAWLAAADAWLAEQGIDLPTLSEQLDGLISKAAAFLMKQGGALVSATVSATSSVVSALVNSLVALTAAVYILADKEHLGAQGRKILCALLPERTLARIQRLLALINQTFSSFVSGQMLDASILGALCFCGMSVLKMPYAAPISVLIAFTALIPMFGSLLGTALGAFLILFVSPLQAVWFVVFIVVLQQIDNNLIYPRVVGKSVGLPGLWVLIAVTVGGGIGGVAGMVASVPTCSVLYTLVREALDRKNAKRAAAEEEN